MPRDIPFIQFLRPDGRQRHVTTEVSHDVGRLAFDLIARGLRLECEELITGEVSFTVTDPEKGDIDIEVVPNGPEVPDAVERLIRRVASTFGLR